MSAAEVPIVEIPKAFLCPISAEVMRHPVFAEDGHTYEEFNIHTWVVKYSFSPITRQPIPCHFIPNYNLIQQIDEFFHNHPELKPQFSSYMWPNGEILFSTSHSIGNLTTESWVGTVTYQILSQPFHQMELVKYGTSPDKISVILSYDPQAEEYLKLSGFKVSEPQPDWLTTENVAQTKKLLSLITIHNSLKNPEDGFPYLSYIMSMLAKV